jgi:FSR family fosmidomycin resistance protein-like MFS transporter
MLFMSIRFLLPIRIAEQGGDLGSIGMVVFCITLGCCFGMIVMGKIAARCGSKMAMLGSLLASSGTLLMAALSTGFFSIIFYVLGLACVYSTVPLTTTMAKLAPDERSMASTIVLGFAWGIGNLMVAPVGKFVDLFGIDAAFILLALLPLLGLPLLLAPPLKMLKN